MAQQIFKGFKQVLEGYNSFEAGFLYFVRTNTGSTDGYLQFNGKKYGTAEDVAVMLGNKIGTLPSGYTNVVDYVNAMVGEGVDELNATVTGESNGVRVEIVEEAGKLTGVTVTAPDFANTYASKSAFEAVSGTVKTINDDYLKAADKTELNNAITTETAARESADNALDTRLDALEAISGQSHEHANKAVLDGISAEKVSAWDAAEQNAKDYADSKVADLDATVTGESHGVTVQIAEVDGKLTGVTVAAPDFDNTYAPKAAFEAVSGKVNDVANSAETRIAALEAASASTRLGNLETSATTWNNLVDGSKVVISAYTSEGVTEGYLKTYEIFQGGESKGKIDIPKDLVVTSGEIVEVGGVKYLRLTIANQEEPVDIAVTDLVDVYTPGDGINISEGNVVSVDIDDANKNGLSVDEDGLKLALATDTNAGAMSAADHTKLTNLEASAATFATTAVTDGLQTAINAATARTEAVAASANTRLEALEALTASTNSALQSISAGDASVSVGAKDADKNQTVAVARSQTADNALELKNDGIYVAPIYYWEEEQQG